MYVDSCSTLSIKRCTKGSAKQGSQLSVLYNDTMPSVALLSDTTQAPERYHDERRSSAAARSPFLSAIYPYGTVPFVPGDFVTQLIYVDEIVSTYRPFKFPNLNLTVSVQAGFSSHSEFRDLDGHVVAFPIWTSHIKNLICTTQTYADKCRMHRVLFPKSRALSFEVAIVNETTGDWVDPCAFYQMPCRCVAFNGLVCSKIDKSGVQTLLEHLLVQNDSK